MFCIQENFYNYHGKFIAGIYTLPQYKYAVSCLKALHSLWTKITKAFWVIILWTFSTLSNRFGTCNRLGKRGT